MTSVKCKSCGGKRLNEVQIKILNQFHGVMQCDKCHRELWSN